MLELFLNPANAVIGGALISSPILIHLINRMRFKRLRWAAMEFLLKSQKRNRRRLIIEQMILLLLRILLVLLTGLLLARFLGFAFAGFQSKNTTHVIILDDRLSAEDRWRTEEGEVKNAFQVGKQIIDKELVKIIAQARTPQRVVLFRLSDPAIHFDRLLNDESQKDLSAELARMEGPTQRHLNLNDGLEEADRIFGQSPQDERFLHVVGDFRQLQWAEPEASTMLKQLRALGNAGVQVHFLDTAHPRRTEGQRVPLYHDNLAIVDLRSETRVAAEGMPVQFTVTVANYSGTEKKNVRVTIKVDGEERPEGSLTLMSVPPGHTSATFQVGFVRLEKELTTTYNVITAQLENEEAGLQSDNLRYAVIGVRKQVPVLVVDGDPANGAKPGGDLFHIRTLLDSARGYKVEPGTVSDLERPNLDQYPSIYLLNVREISDKAKKNLETYVSSGGGLAFFMGDRVNPAFYNRELYDKGKGLFPVLLADQPSKTLSEEDKQAKQLQNVLEPRLQAFVRSDSHPVVAELHKFRNFLTYLNVDRYFPVRRRDWQPEEGRVEELITLPNDHPLADYQASTQEILDELEKLPADNPAYEKFRAALDKHRRAIRDSLSGKSLYLLANALDAVLRDARDPNDAGGTRLTELWEQTDPKVQELKDRITKFRAVVQYGDPLVVAQRFHKGRVVAFLTTAGKKWNDWAGGSPASVTYPMIMIDLQKYLTAADADTAKLVWEQVEIGRPSSRYEAKAKVSLQEYGGATKVEVTQRGDLGSDGKPDTTVGIAGGGPSAPKDLGELLGNVSGESLSFTFPKERTPRPGVYQFELLQRGDMGSEGKKETVAYAFNVDTEHESDLRRTSREELSKYGTPHAPDDGTLASLVDSHHDLSESVWFYVLFLAILVAEQALAVHLSFHLRSSEALPPPQAVRPQPTAA
jgi:hypothetical protein